MPKDEALHRIVSEWVRKAENDLISAITPPNTARQSAHRQYLFPCPTVRGKVSESTTDLSMC